MIKIVPMEEKHIAEITRLEIECFSSPWSEEGLRKELENPRAVFFAAEDESGVWGYIGSHFVLDEADITNIAVAASKRGGGIGSLLMEKLLEKAMECEIKFITLEVRPSNEKAIKLYEKYGFKEVGRRKNFYIKPTEDGVIMTKEFV